MNNAFVVAGAPAIRSMMRKCAQLRLRRRG